MEQRPKRKPNRLPNYDYSQNGAYFLTFSTKNREPLLWTDTIPLEPNRFLWSSDVGANSVRPSCEIPLSRIGKVVEQAILGMETHYPNMTLEKYVVMPNHVHLLISLQNDGGRTMFAPTVSRLIKHTKEWVTKQIGQAIWQKSFHDHVIRDQEGYNEIWLYMDQNPWTWEQDCFHQI